MDKRPVVCIYHANCLDGFSSAWVVYDHMKSLGQEVTFIAATYGDELPLEACKDAIVYIVDFSYAPTDLCQLAKVASWVYLLDHHKSAIEKIEAYGYENFPLNIDFTLDLEKSGVGITWATFHGAKPLTPALAAVQDRDLWRFKLPNTKEVNAALMSYAYDFAIFDNLLCDSIYDRLVQEGRTLLRQEAKEVATIVKNAFLCDFEGFTIPIACCPPWLAPEVGNQLSVGHPFSLTFFEYDTEVRYSLRSQKDGADVSLLAAKHGGGGHKNAAGFAMSLGEAGVVQVLPIPETVQQSFDFLKNAD